MFATAGAYPVSWNLPRAFGPIDARFDHHPPGRSPRIHADYSILYAAEQPSAALAEFFQKTRVINRSLNRPWIAQFTLADKLTLLDLTGGWIVKQKGGAAIASGPREQARKWSRVFHAAYPHVDGICYRSSLNPEWLAVSLYERAIRALPKEPLVQAPLTDARLAPLLDFAIHETGYDLV